jgi:hypothetical protein
MAEIITHVVYVLIRIVVVVGGVYNRDNLGQALDVVLQGELAAIGSGKWQFAEKRSWGLCVNQFLRKPACNACMTEFA